MATVFMILMPLFAIGTTVGLVLGYHKWMHTWIKPWIQHETKDMQDIEDYANRREGRKRE